MKNLILFITLFGIITTGFSQKKSNFEKRAKRSSNAIANEMNLDKEQTAFLYEAILERQQRNFNQIKGQELTKAAKKEIYQASHKTMNDKLSNKFTKAEIKKINGIIRAQQEKKKKSS